jgi:hypothetical protein
MNALIGDIHNELAGLDSQISKEDKANQDMEEKLTEMDKKKEQYKEEIETL